MSADPIGFHIEVVNGPGIARLREFVDAVTVRAALRWALSEGARAYPDGRIEGNFDAGYGDFCSWAIPADEIPAEFRAVVLAEAAAVARELTTS